MEWEQRFCPNASCTSDLWMVQPSSEIAELWQLVDSIAGGTFTVAAVEPVCPRCGTLLRPQLNGASGFDEGTMLQPDRLLDWPLRRSYSHTDWRS